MVRTKKDELLEKLNGLNLTQTKMDWAENIPDDIWEEYFKGNFKEVASNLNVDTRRWYEVSTTVIYIFNFYLGIRHITNIFSESSMIEDCYVKMEFMEMEEVQTTTYRKK